MKEVGVCVRCHLPKEGHKFSTGFLCDECTRLTRNELFAVWASGELSAANSPVWNFVKVNYHTDD